MEVFCHFAPAGATVTAFPASRNRGYARHLVLGSERIAAGQIPAWSPDFVQLRLTQMAL